MTKGGTKGVTAGLTAGQAKSLARRAFEALPRLSRPAPPLPQGPAGRFVVAALERHKREGMELAFRARLGALAVFAVLLPLTFSLQTALYYEVLLVLLALIGWMQRRVAKVGRSGLEMLLLYADILIVTAAALAPNPFRPIDWPAPMEFRSQTFMFFYVFLAFGTLAYSWRTVRGIGSMTVYAWLSGIGLVWLLGTPEPALTEAARTAFGYEPVMVDYLDPNSFLPWIRVQEMVVFMVVAWILGATVRRFSNLLESQATMERERTNLARYFSPNVVDELSQNDEPLKRIRTQSVAVMFVDIIGFTGFASERSAEDVIHTLRAFHGRMEAQVFRHGGTLDKFLGDGLMATFGTPSPGEHDASDALACAREMAASLAEWNAERTAAGEPALRVGIGLHFGPVVLGDIGANRLEFAVIGDTVNVASRVEALTRTLGVQVAATEALVRQARAEAGPGDDPASGLAPLGAHTLRGQTHALEIWGGH